MPTWSKRTFGPGKVHEWAQVQDWFQAHYMLAFPSHWKPERRAEMMLLHVSEEDGGDSLFMALPVGERMYEGFAPVDFAEIPPVPNLLVADQIGYDQLFRK
jgi:hypothetical protein